MGLRGGLKAGAPVGFIDRYVQLVREQVEVAHLHDLDVGVSALRAHYVLLVSGLTLLRHRLPILVHCHQQQIQVPNKGTDDVLLGPHHKVDRAQSLVDEHENTAQIPSLEESLGIHLLGVY